MWITVPWWKLPACDTPRAHARSRGTVTNAFKQMRCVGVIVTVPSAPLRETPCRRGNTNGSPLRVFLRRQAPPVLNRRDRLDRAFVAGPFVEIVLWLPVRGRHRKATAAARGRLKGAPTRASCSDEGRTCQSYALGTNTVRKKMKRIAKFRSRRLGRPVLTERQVFPGPLQPVANIEDRGLLISSSRYLRSALRSTRSI